MLCFLILVFNIGIICVIHTGLVCGWHACSVLDVRVLFHSGLPHWKPAELRPKIHHPHWPAQLRLWSHGGQGTQKPPRGWWETKREYWQAWNVKYMRGKWISDKREERRSFINPSPRLSAINQSQHYSAPTSDPCCSFISTWWASLWGHHTLHEAVYECLWL